MRCSLLAAAAVLAFESAAVACTCTLSDGPAELQHLAAETAGDAVALAEVEVVHTYDPTTSRGEVLRVIRTLAGQPVSLFQVQRDRYPSSASCDIEFEAGQRALLMLYPSADAAAGSMPAYRLSSICRQHLLDKPAYRDEVIRRMQSRIDRGERG
jgi:hypothetical protein